MVYVYPEEGVDFWNDNLVMPKGAPNPDNAKTFINWMMAPENIAMASNFAGYMNAIKGSDEYLDESLAKLTRRSTCRPSTPIACGRRPTAAPRRASCATRCGRGSRSSRASAIWRQPVLVRPAARPLLAGTMPETVTVALWALNVGHPLAGLDAFVALVEARMVEAAGQGADLLVLPEYACEPWLWFAPRPLGRPAELDWLAARAEEALPQARRPAGAPWRGLLAGSDAGAPGEARPDGPHHRNRAHLLPAGRPGGDPGQALPAAARGQSAGYWMAPGDTVRIAHWRGLRLVIAVCLDIELPALAARLAPRAPDLLLVPSMTEKRSGFHRVFGCARARAVELMTTVCAVGCLGTAAGTPTRAPTSAVAAAFLPCEEGLGATGVAAELAPADSCDGSGTAADRPRPADRADSRAAYGRRRGLAGRLVGRPPGHRGGLRKGAVMRTVYSERHRLQDGKAELIDGKLLPCFEKPERAELIIARVREVALGEVLAPEDHGLAPLRRVHAEPYLALPRERLGRPGSPSTAPTTRCRSAGRPAGCGRSSPTASTASCPTSASMPARRSPPAPGRRRAALRTWR